MYSMGCDPEFIPFKNGQPFPITGLLGGEKGNPIMAGPFGGYQEDNVNAEVNPTPANSPAEAVENLVACIKAVQERLVVHGTEIRSIPSAEFKVPMPNSCMRAGCDPDYNVYLKRENDLPDLTGTALRSAGGHVLMEVPKDVYVPDFIKTCDRTLGLMSLEWDKDTRRRELYGKAGAFRWREWEASYLVEYRTLSNAWTASRELMERVFGVFSHVPMYMQKLQEWQGLVPDEEVVRAINQSNAGLAANILKVEGF